MVSDKKAGKRSREVKPKVLHGLKSKEVIELIESLEGVVIDFDQLFYYEHTGLVVPSIRSERSERSARLKTPFTVASFALGRKISGPSTCWVSPGV